MMICKNERKKELSKFIVLSSIVEAVVLPCNSSQIYKPCRKKKSGNNSNSLDFSILFLGEKNSPPNKWNPLNTTHVHNFMELINSTKSRMVRFKLVLSHILRQLVFGSMFLFFHPFRKFITLHTKSIINST